MLKKQDRCHWADSRRILDASRNAAVHRRSLAMIELTDRAGWSLESAAERANRTPGLLSIPPESARAALAPGALVQLLFLIDGPGGAPARCERMWVWISFVRGEEYIGQ